MRWDPGQEFVASELEKEIWAEVKRSEPRAEKRVQALLRYAGDQATKLAHGGLDVSERVQQLELICARYRIAIERLAMSTGHAVTIFDDGRVTLEERPIVDALDGP